MERITPTETNGAMLLDMLSPVEMQPVTPDLTQIEPREELEIMGALAYAQAIWRGAGNPAANRRDHEQLMLIAKLWLMLERAGYGLGE